MRLPKHEYDIVVIGTGPGGATLAYALRHSGARILLIERGEYLPQEPENWDKVEVIRRERYSPKETWVDHKGRPFRAPVYYVVGGQTKVYGAAMLRMRSIDFEAVEHEDGLSPAWPFQYEDLEAYYAQAERIYRVHGEEGEDPVESPRSTPFPFPKVAHEPYVEDLAGRLERQGLHPFHLPVGVDLHAGGKCIRCDTCVGFPCQVHAKSDAEICCVRPALSSPNVELWTGSIAYRLITDRTGKTIDGLEVHRNGEAQLVRASVFVSSCNAVESVALFKRSSSHLYPNGLANSSGLLGCNYMQHNNTTLFAVDPRRKHGTIFQKTLAINDFYSGDKDWPFPIGNMQLSGNAHVEHLFHKRRCLLQWARPKTFFQELTFRGIGWFLMTEDLPEERSKIVWTPTGKIQIHRSRNNLASHLRLIEKAKGMLRRAGYPIILQHTSRLGQTGHYCGTMRAGTDPEKSVLTTFCRTHDIDNLYVVDGSFFPSAPAVNPVLTIAANSLRVADHMKERLQLDMGRKPSGTVLA